MISFEKTVGLVALLSGVAQAWPRFGGCPNYKYKEDFEVERMAGRWYEIVRDSTNTMEFLSECVNVDYV